MNVKKKILKKLRALMAKTILNGATEQEALLATAKVSELLEKYNLEMSEVDIDESNCDSITFDIGKSKAHPIGYLGGAIAELTNTKACIQTYKHPNKKLLIYFGFKKDIEVAHYITEIIYNAMCEEYKEYKKSLNFEFSRIHHNTKRQSFLLGMVWRLNERINQMINQRNIKRNNLQEQSTGTSLIILKNQVVDEEFAEQFGELRSKYHKPIARSQTALHAGLEAGERVIINPAISE